MKILGLGHYSRTGKDTVANNILRQNALILDDPIIAKKIPFAWKLKEICYDLYKWAGLQPPDYYDTPEGEPYRDIVLPELGMTPVELWVKFGTPAVREQVYDSTWIDYVLRNDWGADLLIVPDVRFPNEAAAIHLAGGKLVKVVRQGYGPRQTVADEALLGFEGWDYVAGDHHIDTLKEDAWKLLGWASHGIFPEQTQALREYRLSLEALPCSQ